MNRCEQCGKSIKGFHVVLAYETGSKQFCDHKCADLYAGSRERSGEPPAGSKRDLKADLELFNKATPGPWEFGPIYAGTIAGELDEERDRANRELLNNFREGWPHAIERAIEAEALARELVEALEVAFELLEDHQPNWYLRMHFNQINNVLGSCKEVLGDD